MGIKIYKKGRQAVVWNNGVYYSMEVPDWTALINRQGLYQHILTHMGEPDTRVDHNDFLDQQFDAPIGAQEVWAAGVTYMRSKEARMDEASASGGAVFYDKVYDAPRPELFFKANARRTVGCGEEVYIRKDSSWDVPEPELTLFVNSYGTIQGYTIGNDMSSRSIEGENPLYLPQAKVFERCAALGPCLYVSENPIDPNSEIHLLIRRNGKKMYEAGVKISRMKRTHEELVKYLFMECRFPDGVFLMTGTCLVPPDDFTLKVQDEITISIDHIGTLHNTVGQLGNG